MPPKRSPGKRKGTTPRKTIKAPPRLPAAASAPSLAELRMGAAHRLRRLAFAISQLRDQYAEAAAECDRLRADGDGWTPASVPPAVHALARGGPSASEPEPNLIRALEDNARLREELARLVGFLEELHGALADAMPADNESRG